MVNMSVQKIISVASLAAPKLDFYSILNDTENIHVCNAVIIRLLSQIFQLPYNVLLPHDGEVGTKLPDGNWTGIIGMVQRSEADLAVLSALSYPKFQAVNFSYPYLFSDVTFMTDKPKPNPTSSAIIHPFPLILWISIITVVFIFSCLLYIHIYRKQTFQNIFFMIFGSLLEKSIVMKLRKTNLKLIISSWLIFVFFIINSYKAVLLSVLTLPPLTGIKNIEDLAKAAEKNSVTCYTWKGSDLPQTFLESEFVTWRSIGKCLQRNILNSEDAEVVFLKDPPKKAFIEARTYIKFYEEMYLIPEDTFFYSMHAFPVSKVFHRLNYLNDKIHRLFAAGVFQKIEKDEQLILKLHSTYSLFSEPGRLKILQLGDLKGAFIVLLFGYALSTIVLFTEIIVKRYFPKSNVILCKKRRKFCRICRKT